jgi:hypothetical protein
MGRRLSDRSMKLVFIVAVLVGLVVGYAMPIRIGADLYHFFHGKYPAAVTFTHGIALLPGPAAVIKGESEPMPGCRGVMFTRQTGRGECIKDEWW